MEDYASADPTTGKYGYLRSAKRDQSQNNDDIDGRAKVDSWNMNYSRRKKKLKKKKIKKDHSKRMNELQGIYGVDARTLAGLDRRAEASPVKAGAGKGGKGGKGDDDHDRSNFTNDMNSMRSTMNTFKNTIAGGGRGQPSVFSGGKTNMSRRWGDFESSMGGAETLMKSKLKGLNANQQHPKMKKLTQT